MIEYQMYNFRQFKRVRDECRLIGDDVYVFDVYKRGYLVRIRDLDDLLSLPHHYNKRLVFLVGSQALLLTYYKIQLCTASELFDFLSNFS